MSRVRSVYQSFRCVGRRAFVDVLDLVFPRHCRVCSAAMSEELGPLCQPCADSLVWIGPSCSRCGMAVLNPSPKGDCHECRGRRLYFDHCRAAALYEGCLRELILLHKYRGVPQVCSFLCGLLEETWAANTSIGRPVLVPIPVHPWRALARGRDPLGELVRVFARRTELTVAPLLRRCRYTRSQTRLPRARRVRNPRGSFCLRRRVTVPEHVVLVDDVVTTCATVSEAARVLRRAGARRIDVLAVARSGS